MKLMFTDIRRKQQNYVLVQRFFNQVVKVLLQHGTIAVMFYRFGHCCTLMPVPVRLPFELVHALMAPLVKLLTGIYINPRQTIGGGFVIHNFSNVHIDCAHIGKNLTINQGVYIGKGALSKDKPSIGNNVYVGAGAKIIGKVRIGDNAIVAANSCIIKDVPDCCLVSGVPGVLISRTITSDYVQRGKPHNK
ncbi:serine acetyltransferase [Alteromonas aestuariivivens]|uniref:Serine acetyltransferase n=1 Tax=Alteromonas aestuariivivens TaxID=1938339 RepID=A0A3D8MCV0_9ALTE|nr:serine acetyltransferase [Alteromonas aestuariivivens]RDV27503.1 serine acetyltransferase [Alteromonas aestuariivivens]